MAWYWTGAKPLPELPVMMIEFYDFMYPTYQWYVMISVNTLSIESVASMHVTTGTSSRGVNTLFHSSYKTDFFAASCGMSLGIYINPSWYHMVSQSFVNIGSGNDS